MVSGPFTVSEVVAGDRVAFVPNPFYRDAYFKHAPFLDRVVFKYYPGRDSMLSALRGGSADVGFHLTAEDLHELEAMSGSAPDVHSGLRDEFLNPNRGPNQETGRAPPWVDDPHLLEALARAIDRRVIVEQALGGSGEVSRGLYPAAMRGYADPGLGSPRRDVAGARRLLDDAGWKLNGDGFRVKDGRRLEFSLLGACGSPITTLELALLKQQWQDVGAAVKTDCRRRGIFFASFQDRGTNASGAFDMTLYSNAWGPDPAGWGSFGASSRIPSPAAPNGQNWNRCQDPKLDAEISRGERTLQAAERKSAYLALQREWLDYHCTIPLFEWPLIRQVSRRLHNFAASPIAGADVWNAPDWWLL